jgi:hypothetical protein
VAVVLTVVQTKQIRINIHKRNNTKTQYKHELIPNIKRSQGGSENKILKPLQAL